MFYLFYRKIHLLSFIFCYCTLKDVIKTILLCFIFNHHITFLLSQIFNQFLCDIFRHYFLLQTNKCTTHQKIWSTPHRKHWKMEPYCVSVNCGEGDCDSDTNRLASVIIWPIHFCNKTVLVISQYLNVASLVLWLLLSFWEAPW